MSFPSYSSLFQSGLQAQPAPKRAPTRPRGASLRSFLKLDTRTPRAAPPAVPPLPIVTPNTPSTESPQAPAAMGSSHLYRRSRESLRTIPSPKPVPSERSLPTLPLGVPSLTPSPVSAASSLAPTTPPPLALRPTPARTSSCALGLTLHARRAPETASLAPSSVASPRRRRVQRSAALARLEGPRNFMSMSDEDDDTVSPLSRSAPASPTDTRVARRRTRTVSDASALSRRRTRDFLDIGGADDEDAYVALDAALRTVLGTAPHPAPARVPIPRPAQIFSSFIDVSA